MGDDFHRVSTTFGEDVAEVVGWLLVDRMPKVYRC